METEQIFFLPKVRGRRAAREGKRDGLKMLLPTRLESILFRGSQGKNIFVFICKGKKVTTHPILALKSCFKYTGSQRETELFPRDAAPKGNQL